MGDLIKRFFYKLTGGRPMIYKDHAFIDVVSGREVKYYTDYFGRNWMANTKWSSFRVKTQEHKEGK